MKPKNYTVYCHQNKFNNKRYIGITCQKPENRWKNGRAYISNKHFISSIEKYGWNDGFTHDILFEHLTKEEAEKMEILLIASLKTQDKKYGYNISRGGKAGGIHGWTHTRIHTEYLSMLSRAYKPDGGLCEEWKDFINFRDWSFNNNYDDKLLLMRIDNSKPYGPDNCKWTTRNEIVNNSKLPHKVTYNGETHSVLEWSKILGMSDRTLANRLLHTNWTLEEIFTKTPDRRNQKNNNAVNIEYNGETHNIKEWSEIINIPYKSLYNRIRRGWDIEKAFTTPVRQLHNKEDKYIVDMKNGSWRVQFKANGKQYQSKCLRNINEIRQIRDEMVRLYK